MQMLDRLLIVSFTLVEKSTGRSLDESASADEIKETILYDSAPHTTEDVVVFWGLCSALYNTFADNNNNNNELTVQLEKETLVFLPLEQDIVAIARLQEANISVSTAQRHIQRSHQLFCLLRKGGIQARMDDIKALQQLFTLHKRARKAQNSEAQQSLDEYRWQLALARIRDDLKIHYDTFLTEPMMTSTTTHSFDISPPVHLLPHECNSDKEGETLDMDQLQQHLTQAYDSDDQIIDIVVMEGKEDPSVVACATQDSERQPILSKNEAGILLEHLLHVRESCLLSHLPEGVVGSNYFVVVRTTTTTTALTGFLAPPPLAHLSALDTCAEEVTLVTDEEEERAAWAPCIHLQQKECRVLLYNTNTMVFVAKDCQTISQGALLMSCLEKASRMVMTAGASCRPASSTILGDCECTLVPDKNVWVYRSSQETLLVDATACKTVADVQRAVMEHRNRK